MQVIVLSIHLVVCVALIGLVLLQRSEGGALGMGGGSSGALMSGRGAADALARMTSFAGGFFLITSLLLTVLSGAASTGDRSVFDLIPHSQRNAPVTAPVVPAQPAPTQPAAPDPTQSSAPQAATSQLASSVLPGPGTASAATPTEIAPAPTTAGAHAAPLQSRPTQTSAATVTPLATANRNRQTTTPASTTSTAQVAPTQAPPSATTRRSGSATTTSAVGAQQHPLILPGGNALTDSQTAPESSDATGLQPVRRERAGPDQ